VKAYACIATAVVAQSRDCRNAVINLLNLLGNKAVGLYSVCLHITGKSSLLVLLSSHVREFETADVN